MPSEALKRAINKYDQKQVHIHLRLKDKALKRKIERHLRRRGESMNAFITRAILETMKRDRD